MKEIEEYRVNLLERLEAAAIAFRAECLEVPDPQAPVEENGWNAHQIAAHTRDMDRLVYSLRARRTAAEENPEFLNFDGEAYLRENYNPGESLKDLLDGFVSNVEALTEFLRLLPVEAWSRLSRHTRFGTGLTLQSWVEKDLAHIEEHLASVRSQNRK